MVLYWLVEFTMNWVWFRIQVIVICLIWWQMIFLNINECPCILILKVLFGISHPITTLLFSTALASEQNKAVTLHVLIGWSAWVVPLLYSTSLASEENKAVTLWEFLSWNINCDILIDWHAWVTGSLKPSIKEGGWHKEWKGCRPLYTDMLKSMTFSYRTKVQIMELIQFSHCFKTK